MQAAHRISFYAERGPFGTTKIFEFIKRGLLEAQKIDKSTFITEAAWNRFIENAPLALDARRKRAEGEAPR